MAEIVALRMADLLIDAENPRLPQPNVGQRDAQRALARDQQRKLLVLARDILKSGLNPSDLPIVVATHDDRSRYTVLEGNRRLVALKALENPETLVGAVSDAILAELRKLSKEYLESPIESVQCTVFRDRQEADHWIELRHTGENDGAGIVRWNSDEVSRFRARSGGTEFHSQVLNFLEARGDLTPEGRRKVPATSLKRILGTPEVRAKCGIGQTDGQLTFLAPAKPVARALLHIVQDLASGRTKTSDIYTREHRIAYANRIPSNIVVKLTRKSGKGNAAADPRAASQPKHKPKPTTPKPRDFLIPRDCALTIAEARIREIETELRLLSLQSYSNAVSVLFRVFIELSADAHIATRGLQASSDKLRNKLEAVLGDLTKRQKLTKQQASPVRRALQKDSFLAPSVALMNDYVHNQYVFPAAGDLRAHWNSLQPFMVAVWSP